MVLPLDPRNDIITLPTRVFGPTGGSVVRLLLDTGATRSMLNRESALFLGYDLESTSKLVRTITASGAVLAPQVVLLRIEVMHQVLHNFPILCHTLPADVGADGVLGLDFFRGRRLTLDFRVGLVMLD